MIKSDLPRENIEKNTKANELESKDRKFTVDRTSECDILSEERIEQCKNKKLKEEKINFVIEENNRYWTNIELAPNFDKCYSSLDSNKISISAASYCYWKSINPDILPPSEFFSLKLDDYHDVACLHLSHIYDQEDYCNAGKAIYTKNIAMCDNTGNAIKDCYYGQALHNDEFSLRHCDSIQEKNIFDVNETRYCYILVAAKTNDYTLCNMPQIVTDTVKELQQIEECKEKIDTYSIWKANTNQ